MSGIDWENISRAGKEVARNAQGLKGEERGFIMQLGNHVEAIAKAAAMEIQRLEGQLAQIRKRIDKIEKTHGS